MFMIKATELYNCLIVFITMLHNVNTTVLIS